MAAEYFHFVQRQDSFWRVYTECVCVCQVCGAFQPGRGTQKITLQTNCRPKLTKSRMFVDLHLITRNWLIGVHVSVCHLSVQVSDVPVPSASHLE